MPKATELTDEQKKIHAHLQRLLAELPKSPGVYQFKDKEGKVIYVGKAKNLRNRVRSYFREKEHEYQKVEIMRKKIVDIELITVHSELEALILETNLIKQLHPRYNIVMRDDKNYVYVKITVQKDFPEIYTVRRMMKDGAKYFGPYTSSNSIYRTLKVLQRIFPFRSCLGTIDEISSPPGGISAMPMEAGPTPVGKEEYRQGKVLVHIKGLNRMAPCLDYHIKRCIGPCIGTATRQEYGELINSVMKFLEGKTEEIVSQLRMQMEHAVQTKSFEEAARTRDKLLALDTVLEKQRVVSTKQADQDVLAVAQDKNDAVANVFQIRGGKLIGRETFPLKTESIINADRSILEQFIAQYYPEVADIPPEIIVDAGEESCKALEAYLSELRGKRVAVTLAQRGEKKRLVELVQENANRSLAEMKVRWMTDEARTKGALKELSDALHMEKLQRIECYDISHIQGTDTVASMVVFIGGMPYKAHYRRFKVKSLPEGQTDDFAAMMEVLQRRLTRIQETLLAPSPEPEQPAQILEIETGETETVPVKSPEPKEKKKKQKDNEGFSEVPDLIILDGGKGQLSSVMQVVETLGLTDKVKIVALAKQEEELFLPGESEPLILPRESNGLFLVQRIRDEAHRFALSYHQHLRSKKMVKSVLDTIRGIGPAAKKKLLAKFGSTVGIKNASFEDVAAVVGDATAQKVKEVL